MSAPTQPSELADELPPAEPPVEEERERGFLPLEIRELVERVTVLRVGALIVNLALIVWLVWNKRLFGVMPPAVTEKVSTLTAGLSDLLSVDKQETVSQLVTERIFLERVSPLNFAIDPELSGFWNNNHVARNKRQAFGYDIIVRRLYR